MMLAMTKRSEKMSCRLEHDLRKKVDKAAIATKRSPSEFMRDALQREVSRSLGNWDMGMRIATRDQMGGP